MCGYLKDVSKQYVLNMFYLTFDGNANNVLKYI